MNGASERASGEADGPVLYASISYHIHPLCTGDRKNYATHFFFPKHLTNKNGVIASSIFVARNDTPSVSALVLRFYHKSSIIFCTGVLTFYEEDLLITTVLGQRDSNVWDPVKYNFLQISSLANTIVIDTSDLCISTLSPFLPPTTTLPVSGQSQLEFTASIVCLSIVCLPIVCVSLSKGRISCSIRNCQYCVAHEK